MPTSWAAMSMAAVSSTMCWGPRCRAASGEASSIASSGRIQWPSSRRDAPNTSHSGGRSGESTITIVGSSRSIFWRPVGGVPMLTPWPSVYAITRSWSSASTILERLNPMVLPSLSTSDWKTSMRLHVAGVVEDLAGVDDRVRDRDEVDSARLPPAS